MGGEFVVDFYGTLVDSSVIGDQCLRWDLIFLACLCLSLQTLKKKKVFLFVKIIRATGHPVWTVSVVCVKLKC